ncbi:MULTISPECIES: restriction endonuclease [unclassified Pseudoalteromonas]|uniref:restriction endonuclease n=1 Tax=unclassified Pseudoalteromonas TaxID=194690 RepID=UPI001603BF6E|nr:MULTISPECIES: restriction endonuclease [unclassified Pseudoalteromonas]MBB1333151.1 restriction endonuclease [Pseudoalteromonas sp. SR41-6]MBB1458022.1 restriction endonuclease [Pseudoalteromonas sp. SG41-8]
MSNNGREYENFVAALHQALFDSEKWTELKNIKIEQSKKINDNFGIAREFDLYWEYEFAGITYKTVIECKDYASKVSIEKIDALLGKIRDIPDLKPIFATKTGYQSGAKTKALNNKVELLIVREQNDSDWVLEDGTPLIKQVNIDIHAISAARITSFNTKMDGKWIKENTNLDTSSGNLQLSMQNDQTVIEDVGRNDKYSLKELEERLGQGTDTNFGERSLSLKFDEAYLHCDDLKLKLKEVDLTYHIPKPIHQPMNIDFSKELVGVIEYLGKSSKTAIFKDHVVKGWSVKT